MISIRLYQDNKVRPDNTSTIYYVLAHKGKRKYISTKIHLPKKQFDNASGIVLKGAKNHQKLNSYFQLQLEKLRNIVIDLENAGLEPTFDKIEVKFSNDSAAIDFIEWSLSELRNEKGSIAFKTYVGYRDRLENLKKYKPTIMMNEINHDFLVNLRRHFNLIGRKPNGQYQDFATIKKFYRLAVQKGLAKGNPFENFKLEKEKTDKAWLTKENLKTLHALLDTNKIKDKDKNTLRHFLFSCYTGIRFGDKKAFDENNVVEDRIVIRQQKTGKPVQIPFTNQATNLLPAILSRPLKVGNNRVNEDLKVSMKAAGIKKKITYHSSRHTFAINCLLAGIDLITVRDWLGHSTVTTTEIYAKIADQYKDESMKKLGDFLG